MKKVAIILISFIYLYSTAYSQKAIMSVPADDLVGTFVRSDGAEIELILKSPYQFYVKGLAVSFRGNMAELDYVVYYYEDENVMKYESEDYTLTIHVEDENTLHVSEDGFNEIAGIGIGFTGVYTRK